MKPQMKSMAAVLVAASVAASMAACAAPAASTKATQPQQTAGERRLERARALVDSMAERLGALLVDIEAAGGDEARIKEVGDGFKAAAEAMKVEGEALNKVMTAEEKKVMEAYAQKVVAPLMGKLMAVMTEALPAQPEGQDGTP